MLYTVKEVSELSKVTVKALHHYHKIGLLLPHEITEAGYRLYGIRELERLQEILLYRELDFPLEQIKRLLAGETDRTFILASQMELLQLRKQRLEKILETLRASVASAERGETMDEKTMFQGFESEEAWKEALKEQQEYLKETYEVEWPDSAALDIQRMNDMAAEATRFMQAMAEALRGGVKHTDESVCGLLRSHIDFLNRQGHVLSAADFAAQTSFFLNDDFHLRMLEEQQTGLAYYLSAAADAWAQASV
ncbi:MerR family transcriptional regulator [Paenibacillus filicis]|uniref:MerR family transcriptional regulator n=1 Tax=Paenibacillus filicis TaxID=669464 RepID=A0ABU9DCQ6_9BACL